MIGTLPVPLPMATAARAPTLKSNPRRKHRPGEMWWYVLLTAVVVLIYGRVLSFDLLLWDDNLTIRTNRLLFPTFTWNSLIEIFRRPNLGMYMPVTLSFFGVEAWISQHLPWSDTQGAVHPWVFHTGNLLLHIACVALVYTIFKDLLAHRRAAFLGAMLFALHPMQAEPVSWVTETKTLMGAVWTLAAICVYLRHDANVANIVKAEHVQKWRTFFSARYLLATAFFVLALLSKPTAVVAPVLAGLLAWCFQGRDVRRQIVLLWPWLLMAGVVVVVTKGEQPDAIVHTVPGLFGRLLVAGDATAFYLLKLIVPINLAMDYGRTPAFVLASTGSYVAWTIPLAVLLLLFVFGRRGPYLVAYGMFLVALVPVMGLVPFEYQNTSTVADRYFYLAILGPALGFAALVDRRDRPGRIIVAAIVVGTLAVATFRQTGFWRNDESLYTRALAIHADSHAALVNLALVRLRQASQIDPSYRDQAETLLQHALQVAPTPQVQVEDLCRIATTMLARGNVKAAVEKLLEAQRLNPDDAKVYSYLGDVFAVSGQHQEALEHYQKAIALSPEFTHPHYQSGEMLRKLGQFEAAETAFHRALQIRPGSAAALRGLAGYYADIGEYRRARETYDEAIRSGPHEWINYYKKGLYLFERGRFDEAAKFIRKASQLNPRAAGVHNDLGTTLVKLKRFPEAAAHYRTALELDPRLDDARNNLRKVEAAMRR